MPSYKQMKLFSLAAGLPAVFAYPNSHRRDALQSRADRFVWGAIGDSWASGVSYGVGGTTDYDGNKDECLRINHAYSAQVSQRTADWLPGGQEREFHFAACSGSRLVNMAHESFNGHIQMDIVGEKPKVVTMQAGGNNANFYDVASNCIFHDQKKDYGKPFPEQGECTAALQRSGSYIRDKNGLEFDVIATIRDVMNKQRDNPDFHLYVIGYAHFFDVREESTWCDTNSFNIANNWFENREQMQYLVLDLRKQINALVEDLNQALRRSVESFNNPKIVYVDVSKGFDGHRFCEIGHSLLDQFFGGKVWLWNWIGNLVMQTGNLAVESEPTMEQQLHWLEKGTLTDDPNEVVTWKGETVANSPHQGAGVGSMLRPFHPTKDGHGAIANAIVEQLKKDFSE